MAFAATADQMEEFRRRNARLNHARLCSDLVTAAKLREDYNDQHSKAAHVGYMQDELEAAVALNRGSFTLIEGGLNGAALVS